MKKRNITERIAPGKKRRIEIGCGEKTITDRARHTSRQMQAAKRACTSPLEKMMLKSPNTRSEKARYGRRVRQRKRKMQAAIRQRAALTS